MKEYKTQDETKIDEAKEPTIDYNKVYTYGDYLKLEIDEMVEIIRGKIFRMCATFTNQYKMRDCEVYIFSRLIVFFIFRNGSS